MREILYCDGYRPGAIAASIRLHLSYYAPTWGFGAAFESKLAREMGEFIGRHDPARDLFLTAWAGDQLAGTITIDGEGADIEGAHLRWFIVDAALRGQGLGKDLMRRATNFLDQKGYRRCYLTTFGGLDAARKLYEIHAFELVHEERFDPWSGAVGLQRFERHS